MIRPTRSAALWLAAVLVTITMAVPLAAQPLPLRATVDGRMLQTIDGTPFFWLADTAWHLFRLDPTEVDQYLTDRRDKGFTVIQGPVLLADEANHQGQSNGNPDALNESWFQHIDAIVAAAEAADLYIAPVLTWGTYADRFTLDSAETFGRVIGERYGHQTNIAAFIVAGEYNYPGSNDPELWNRMALGLRAGSGGARLITIHPRWFGGTEGQTSSHDFHGAPWLSFNMIQSSQYGDCTNDPSSNRYLGSHNWLLVDHDRNLVPARPSFDSEPTYEMIQPGGPPNCDMAQSRWDAFGVRRRAYWSVLAGGFGVGYGANGVFQFNQTDDPVNAWAPIDVWDDAIHYPGAAQMGHLRRLIESRPVLSRQPAQDLVVSPNTDDIPEHVQAAADECGRFAFVYVPRTGVTIDVDVAHIGGDVISAWWFNPLDGSADALGLFDRELLGDLLSFTTPTDGEDWVLVLDDPAEAFPPPGDAYEIAPADPDLNGDGVVDIDDLLPVLLDWNSGRNGIGNLNRDCHVDVADLLIVLYNWGSLEPLPPPM